MEKQQLIDCVKTEEFSALGKENQNGSAELVKHINRESSPDNATGPYTPRVLPNFEGTGWRGGIGGDQGAWMVPFTLPDLHLSLLSNWAFKIG